jgi:hypothetical protein
MLLKQKPLPQDTHPSDSTSFFDDIFSNNSSLLIKNYYDSGSFGPAYSGWRHVAQNELAPSRALVNQICERLDLNTMDETFGKQGIH